MSWSWSDIFIRSSNQSSAEQADNYARQQAEYQRQLEERQAAETLPEDYVPYAGGELEVQDYAAWEGFQEGAQEGLQNVLEAPGRVVGAVGSGASTLLGGVLKNVPWWVYVAGAAALFVWMGGLSLLRGRLAR